jgi:diaminopimelate epimerase
MQFYKLQATGNDFVFIDDAHFIPDQDRIQKMCDRHYGIGSDGLVFLKHKSGKEFDWVFFNPDGQEAEMCGNAARATTWFLHQQKSLNEVLVNTRVGTFRGSVLGPQNVAIETDIPAAQSRIITNLFSSRFAQGTFTNTGVPHCVIEVDGIASVMTRAQELSGFIYDPEFGPKGANLTFYSVKSESQLQGVTLERGVNDFTLSCGTGVIAAAQIYAQKNKKTGEISVQTPGGELKVEFLNPQRARLSGAAQFVFEGSWK